MEFVWFILPRIGPHTGPFALRGHCCTNKISQLAIDWRESPHATRAFEPRE